MRKILVILGALMLLLLSATASQAHSNGIQWAGYTWHVYKGTGALGQKWDPSHVSVNSSGNLVEKVYNNVAGGVSMPLYKGVGTTWSVTYRIPSGGSKYAILLMPKGSRRPEVDFAEGKPTGDQSKLVTGTYHPLPGCTNCTHAQVTTNLRNWQTFAVHWTSAGFSLTLNGKQWAFFKSSYRGQMHLDLQSANRPSGASATFEFAHVKVS